LHEKDRGRPKAQYWMLPPSQRVRALWSQPESGAGPSEHAPIVVSPGPAPQARPAAAQSTRTDRPP
jgi:hypothetical protein